MNIAYDVIVVGSGAAGLSAALAAAHDGARVLVLEKSRWLGGTTAMSGAGTWVPGNHHMKAAGIDDSPEETMSFSVPGLKPGQHQVTLRATDAKGNQSFQTVFVTVKEPVAAVGADPRVRP